MGRRHVALLVEDEAVMAAELGVLLDSLGHDHVHVTNRADADRVLETHEFCYVLLDLQIKASPDSIKPLVEAGQSLLELIRERYPKVDEVGKHLLQILVVSGHAKEHEYVVDAFQAGANDFVQKPIGANRPSLKDKIQSALRRSGREKHEGCAAVTRAARGGVVSAALEVVARTAGTIEIAIVGRQADKRFEVRIADKPVFLTNASLLLLLKLYAARLRGVDGWAHKNHDLGVQNDQGWKGMTRFREELAPHLRPKTQAVENDGRGNYRLHSDLVIASIEIAQLEMIVNPDLTPVLGEIKQLLARD